MEIISGIDNFRYPFDTCVTIGTFDGLHKGHQEVLKQLKKIALEKKLKSLAVTFSPHPRQVLCPNAKVFFVLSKQEKIEAFEKIGIDYLVIQPFSLEFAKLSAEDFFKNMLCKHLNMKYLVKGFNNHFGKDRVSEFSEIQKIGFNCGFEVSETKKMVLKSSLEVSSTALRKYILEGQFENVSEILGRGFPLSGKVVHGKQIGKTIGFPTANIILDDENKIIPKIGVYASFTIINGRKYPVMLNVGSNPTINGENEKQVFLEAHILDFSDNLYSKKIRLTIVKRIRDEKKFSSLEELKRHLNLDKSLVAEIIQTSL